MVNIKLLSVLFILLIPLVSADYTQLGTTDNNYLLDNYRFNSSVQITEYIAPLQLPKQYPLTADFTGDGIEEIFVIDDGVIKMYSSELELIDGWTVINYDERDFNYILGDHDQNGLMEVAFAGGFMDSFTVIEYNGTEFNIIIEDTDLANIENGECVLGINQNPQGYVGYCINRNGATQISAAIYGFFWDTNGQDEKLIYNYNGADVYDFSCLPEGISVHSEDIDKDGKVEHTINWMTYGSGSSIDEIIYFLSFYVKPDGNIDEETVYQYNVGNVIQGFDDDRRCWSEKYNFTDYMSAATIGEFDGISSNGKEYAVGYRIDANDREKFRLGIFSNTGIPILTKPDLLGDAALGRIISNAFQANVFSDTGLDPCIMAYNQEDQEFSVLCVSPYSTEPWALSSYMFWTYNTTQLGLISEGFKEYNRLTHAIHIDGSDLVSEMMTPYGIMGLSDNCFTVFCDLEYVYDSSRRQSVTIGSDINQDGFGDLIILQDNALWIQYDGIVPQPPVIQGNYYIEPCLEEPWKVNTTVKVEFTAFDPDNPILYAWVVLYDGEPYAVSSSNVTIQSGQTAIFNVWELIADTLDSNAELTFYVSDGVFTASESFNFAVYEDGVSRGEGCFTEGVIETEETVQISQACVTDQFCPSGQKCQSGLCIDKTPEDLTDEILNPAIIPQGFRPFLGLLIILAAVLGSGYVLSQGGISDGAALTYVPIFAGVIAWIVSVIFGLLATWTILFGLLVSGAIIGWRVYSGSTA